MMRPIEINLMAICNLMRAVSQSLPVIKRFGLFITYERLNEALELCGSPDENLLHELLTSIEKERRQAMMYELLAKLEALIEKWQNAPYTDNYTKAAKSVCASELRNVIG